MTAPHSPSQGSSAPAISAPWAGCDLSSDPLLVGGLAGLVEQRWRAPAACRCRAGSTAQRSRSRSRAGMRICSASRSVNIRTRSACPRVGRSWALSAATSARISRATAPGSAPASWTRRSCSSIGRRRIASRATPSRDGARSGNSMFRSSRVASGRARRPSAVDEDQRQRWRRRPARRGHRPGPAARSAAAAGVRTASAAPNGREHRRAEHHDPHGRGRARDGGPTWPRRRPAPTLSPPRLTFPLTSTGRDPPLIGHPGDRATGDRVGPAGPDPGTAVSGPLTPRRPTPGAWPHARVPSSYVILRAA